MRVHTSEWMAKSVMWWHTNRGNLWGIHSAASTSRSEGNRQYSVLPRRPYLYAVLLVLNPLFYHQEPDSHEVHLLSRSDTQVRNYGFLPQYFRRSILRAARAYGVTLFLFPFASHSRYEIKRAGGGSSIYSVIYRCRDRISHVRLSLFRFPFVFQLQECLKSYGRGYESSYKKRNRLVHLLSLCAVYFK